MDNIIEHELKNDEKVNFEDVSKGLSTMWTFVKSPIDSISNSYETLKNGLAKTVERLEYLGAYEYSYGGGYVGVNLGLMMADPAGKIRNMGGGVGKVVTKIDGAILEMIEKVVDLKVVKLGNVYVLKFHNLTTKIAVKFDKGMQEYIIKRLGMMDDDIY